jgi:uncharacterized membrane protein
MNKERKKIILKFSLWLIISFVISQGLIYLLTKDNFFTTPMYIFLPLVGFIGFYYLTPILEKYIDYKNKYKIALVFAVLGLFAFYIAILFYAWQIKLLNPNWPMQLQFFKVLLDSAFLEFIISGIIGIIFSEK